MTSLQQDARQLERGEEGRGKGTLTGPADDVGLEAPREDAVYDAAAVVGVVGGEGGAGVLVEDVEGGDEELVGVLLLVAGEVPRLRPHQVQHPVGDVRSPLAPVKLLLFSSLSSPIPPYELKGEPGICPTFGT